MSLHYNQLTPAQAEAIAILSEEAGEVVQICGKILRHGLENYHPANTRTTNRVILCRELGDITAAGYLLVRTGILSAADTSQIQRELAWSKLDRIRPWLRHIEL